MHLKSLIVPAAIISAILISGCGSGQSENAANLPVNAAPANAIANGSPSDKNPLETKPAEREATLNDAPTVGPVFRAYCSALEKRDEKALRQIYSADSIRDFEKAMKEDGIASLAEFLAIDKASSDLCEVRNEKISGNTATAEVRTKGMPHGAKIVFIKEAGNWKLTNRVEGFEKK